MPRIHQGCRCSIPNVRDKTARGETRAEAQNKRVRARQRVLLRGQPSGPRVGAGAGWQPAVPGEQEDKEGFL